MRRRKKGKLNNIDLNSKPNTTEYENNQWLKESPRKPSLCHLKHAMANHKPQLFILSAIVQFINMQILSGEGSFEHFRAKAIDTYTLRSTVDVRPGVRPGLEMNPKV